MKWFGFFCVTFFFCTMPIFSMQPPPLSLHERACPKCCSSLLNTGEREFSCRHSLCVDCYELKKAECQDPMHRKNVTCPEPECNTIIQSLILPSTNIFLTRYENAVLARLIGSENIDMINRLRSANVGPGKDINYLCATFVERRQAGTLLKKMREEYDALDVQHCALIRKFNQIYRLNPEGFMQEFRIEQLERNLQNEHDIKERLRSNVRHETEEKERLNDRVQRLQNSHDQLADQVRRQREEHVPQVNRLESRIRDFERTNQEFSENERRERNRKERTTRLFQQNLSRQKNWGIAGAFVSALMAGFGTKKIAGNDPQRKNESDSIWAGVTVGALVLWLGLSFVVRSHRQQLQALYAAQR